MDELTLFYGGGLGLLLLLSVGAALRARPRPSPVAARLAEAPHRPIGGLRLGELARVTGAVARLGNSSLLGAPVSGRACVAWAIAIWIWDPLTRSWQLRIDDAEAIDFALEDPTGRLAVLPTRFRIELDPDAGTNEEDASLSPTLRAFLEERGLSGDWSASELRAVEGVLAPGERATVAGRVDRAPRRHAGYRGAASTFALRPPPGEPLVAVEHGGGERASRA